MPDAIKLLIYDYCLKKAPTL